MRDLLIHIQADTHVAHKRVESTGSTGSPRPSATKGEMNQDV